MHRDYRTQYFKYKAKYISDIIKQIGGEGEDKLRLVDIVQNKGEEDKLEIYINPQRKKYLVWEKPNLNVEHVDLLIKHKKYIKSYGKYISMMSVLDSELFDDIKKGFGIKNFKENIHKYLDDKVFEILMSNAQLYSREKERLKTENKKG